MEEKFCKFQSVCGTINMVLKGNKKQITNIPLNVKTHDCRHKLM